MAKKTFKISQVKRKFHLRNKLRKPGNSRGKSKKPLPYYGYKPPQQQPEEQEDIPEDIIGMVEDDDLDFLRDAATRRSYEILKKIRLPTPSGPRARKRDASDDGELERQYEQDMDLPDPKKTKLLLPIKTKDGLVMRSTEVNEEDEEKQKLEYEMRERQKAEERRLKKQKKKEMKKQKRGDEAEEEDEEEEEEEEEDDGDDMKFLDEMYKLSDPPTDKDIPSVSAVDLLVCRADLLQKRKFQIGLLASGLLETPEMKVRNFKVLLDILNNDKSEVKLTVQKLTAVSLMEVFKDVLPSYQIKHQETPPGFKLKKATEQLQNYEKSLLKAYKLYLQSLEHMSKILQGRRGDSGDRGPKAESLGVVAVRCMTELLVSHPYFNFSPNVGQALVHFLDHKNVTIREMVSRGLRTVLKEDKRGELSLHIVRRINHLVRKKNHSVRPEVLMVLLALRLKDVNLEAEKEAEIKEKKLQAHKKRLLNLSKRERKKKKRLEDVEQEMLETKAEENKQKKHQYLTEVTKTVFTIFFRVLKSAPSSKLLSVALEGLAKFAHCINFEFFQDIINVLDHLLVDGNLGHMEQLHCVETVFTILTGHGEALNIDPLRFYTHLYLCLLEVRADRINTEAVTVLRTLERAVIARQRKTSFQRLLAITKRLCTFAPHMLHGAALGYMAVIRSVLTQTKSSDVLLDTDVSHGQGIYQPELPEPEYCCASASVLWELLLLKQHYHPQVKKMARILIDDCSASPPAEIAKLSPSQIAETYDCSQMIFRPAVQPPRKTKPRPHKGRLVLTDETLATYMQDIEKSLNFETLLDWETLEQKELPKTENL